MQLVSLESVPERDSLKGCLTLACSAGASHAVAAFPASTPTHLGALALTPQTSK